MNREGTPFFSTRGGCVWCLRACFGARLLLQSYQYRNFSEGADGRVAGQLRGDPFSGVTKSGRVWRKVPESDTRSVVLYSLQTICKALGWEAKGPRFDPLWLSFLFKMCFMDIALLMVTSRPHPSRPRPVNHCDGDSVELDTVSLSPHLLGSRSLAVQR